MGIKDTTQKPTESELEILQVLWKNNSATVRTVHEELSATKNAGYTTTLKLLQIMYEKGLVNRDESGKTHIYFPLASKEKTQKMLLGKLMNTLFDGSPSQLILQALGESKPNKEEIKQIEQLLESLK
jgi:BlaI family transcriptional regulator, penicillinase repressor